MEKRSQQIMLRRMPHIALLVLILISSGLSGCEPSFQKSFVSRSPAVSSIREPARSVVEVELPSTSLTATSMPEHPTASMAPAPSAATAIQAAPTPQTGEGQDRMVVGPDNFPTGINPLTGLEVANP